MEVNVFFFFKQKTAYELRISDWSSDVCSSDLEVVGEVAVERPGLGRQRGQRRLGEAVSRLVAGEGQLDGRLGVVRFVAAVPVHVFDALGDDGPVVAGHGALGALHVELRAPDPGDVGLEEDRQSVVSGKSVSVRVKLCGRRIIKKKTKNTNRKSLI